MVRKGPFSVGDEVSVEGDTKGKSFMKSKKEAQRDPKVNMPNVTGLALMVRRQPSSLHRSWSH